MSHRAWTVRDAARVLRRPTADDDKYSRGVVGCAPARTPYPGAAVLGVEAAWRAGAGMVRYRRAGDCGIACPGASARDGARPTGRVQAWVIGSGTDAAQRSDADTAALREHPARQTAGRRRTPGRSISPRRARRRGSSPRTAGARPPAGDARAGRDCADDGCRPGGIRARDRGRARRDGAAQGRRTIVASPSGWLTARRRSGRPGWRPPERAMCSPGSIGAPWSPERPDATARLSGLSPRPASGCTGARRRLAAGRSAVRPAGPITALDVAEALPRAVAEAIAAR